LPAKGTGTVPIVSAHFCSLWLKLETSRFVDRLAKWNILVLMWHSTSQIGVTWLIENFSPPEITLKQLMLKTTDFYCAMHAQYMLWPWVCVCLSVSVTSQCSTKMAKHRITQTTPHDSPGTLVFWSQRSLRNSTGVPPTGAPNAGGVG